MFNLKNKTCQEKITEVTSSSNRLKSCFLSDQSFPDQCNRFCKSLDDILHQCFRKVRVGIQNQNTEINELTKLKSELKTFLDTNKCKIADRLARSKLETIDENLSNLTSNQNINLVKEHVQNFETLDGNFS